MAPAWTPGVSPASLPYARSRRGNSRRAIAAAIVIAALAVGATGGNSWLRSRRGPQWASHWDPRVADLVTYVEHQRKLTFKHPVRVDFLTAAQYTARTTADANKVSDKERKKLDEALGTLRATGLASGKVDLLGAVNQLADDGTLAFYDPSAKRVFVRGTELTPPLRATLVHELTHAAQDQYFDLGRMKKFTTDGAESAFRAVVEGDAMRIENDYVNSMTAADRAAYDKAEAADAGDGGGSAGKLDGVPPAMTAMFAAPYALGAPLIHLLETTGGSSAIDDALRVPPTDEGELFDPFRFLVHRSAQQPDEPKLDPGDRRIDDGDFGAVALYLMLAQQFDPHVALRAADDWDGDASLSYVHDGRPCVRVAFLADTTSAGDDLRGILRQWAAGRPAGSATIGGAADVVSLQACDPGEGAAPTGPGASPESLMLPIARTELATGMIQSSVPQELARCVAGRIVDQHRADDFRNENAQALMTKAFVDEARRAAATCRG